MAVYAWDRQRIAEIASGLDKEAEKIQEQKKKLVSYRQLVETNYKGDAAVEFLKNMDADIKEAEQVYVAIHDQASLLQKISNEIYRNCEEELTQKLRVLQEYIG